MSTVAALGPMERADSARLEPGLGAGASGLLSVLGTVAMCLPFSKPQFPYLWKGGGNKTYHLELLWGFTGLSNIIETPTIRKFQ